MADVLISAHNPITGPRHLGQYVSTMKEWPGLIEKYDCVFLIDDVLASFLYPHDRDKIANRSFFTVKDFMLCGIDLNRCAIVLSSMIPEALEMMVILTAFIDQAHINRLYSESFAGQLKSYHRTQLGLGNYPTVAEVLYPQLGLPAATLGMNARYFQGGEEIRGYIYVMQELTANLNRSIGFGRLQVPELHTPACPFLVGTDGNYMIVGNGLNLAASPEEIREIVNRIRGTDVLIEWYRALDQPRLASELEPGSVCTADMKRKLTAFLIEYLHPYRNDRITNRQIQEVLQAGARKIRPTILDNCRELKSYLGIPRIAG